MFVFVTLLGCDAAETKLPDAVSLDLTYTAPPGPLCEEPDPNTQQASECCDAPRAAPTMVASVLDLSRPGMLDVGTCATYFGSSPKRGVRLPTERAAYPLKVILPAPRGPEPGCGMCPPGDSPTAFGIAIEAQHVVGPGHGLAVLVPPPWEFVSGGCGEACAWPCLSGYQEFGRRSCIELAYGDFGFATADPIAPSVEALIEWIDAEPGQLGEANCCPYR